MNDEDLVWTTRDGRRLKLKEMEPSHLQNAARMLRLKIERKESAYWSVGSMLQGEFAQYEWEASMDDVLEAARYWRYMADAMDRVRLRKTRLPPA